MATYTYTSKLNKGQLNFDEQKIIGALGQSGDEAGSDTIELVPDIDLYPNDQYLVIDPTGPDHIHIRAGGPQDDSDATLILGGEKSSIIIDDQADGHVSILSRTEDDTTSHVWQFYNDGSTRFPLITADLHNGGTQLAEVLQFNSADHQSVITNAAPAVGVNAQRIIIQGQRASEGGEGGDVYLWGGDADTGGGDIKIYAGDADGVDVGSGGYVNIDGGAGYDSGGAVNITGGPSSGGAAGNVTLNGGSGSGVDAGEVIITSNSNSWTFGNDGNITIPTAKDILEVSGGNDCSLTSGGNRYKSYNSASGVNVTYDTENIILITTTANATTVRLPEIKDIPIGYTFTVMDFSGGAASKNITILPKSTDEIISVGPAASGGVIIDTNYGLVTLKNVYAGWAILYGR